VLFEVLFTAITGVVKKYFIAHISKNKKYMHCKQVCTAMPKEAKRNRPLIRNTFANMAG
jgi:hypothetical protein